MYRLTTLLGLPQNRFASVHVVGTNGKSSVTRMVAALLEAHGLSTGACVSPHPARWSERVLLGGEEIEPAAFDAAVEHVARVAEVVDRGLEAGEQVTQFEAATAAAFVAFADAGVDVAVVEAGLGGKLDATNTIPSRVAVLTSIGLDHTEWLGETELEIAAEKLDVLRDFTTLVVGRVSEEVAELAAATSRARGARFVRAPEDPGVGLEVGAAGAFQRRNFALACAAAEVFLGPLDLTLAAEVGASLTVPGRLELLPGEPPTLLDVAHNPDGAVALAESLDPVVVGRPVIACLAVLADKDARAMLAALAPAVTRLIATELPNLPADGPIGQGGLDLSARRRSLADDELARMAIEAGIETEAIDDFEAALLRGREWARENDGVLLVAGSHYVLAPTRAALALWKD